MLLVELLLWHLPGEPWNSLTLNPLLLHQVTADSLMSQMQVRWAWVMEELGWDAGPVCVQRLALGLALPWGLAYT